ncbi:hypothetical protein C9374_005843 [Naegleria lovaniensis]|uniref:Uncharacterized protein n=1 Tax=Naegleria lovaniensis TaxID=51637 RepID=A0AA88GJB2_NAELO|nr:uncharacterized protein C9374_005843 [Naegleria lovaniensis]KAG2382051.1 hypothetical protein C9374_005843 [Naegleria lovaniensis]
MSFSRLTETNDIHVRGVLSFEEMERLRQSVRSTLISKETSFYHGKDMKEEQEKASSLMAPLLESNPYVGIASPFQADPELKEDIIPKYLRAAKEQILASEGWNDLKNEIRKRVQTVIDEQIALRTEISDHTLETGGAVHMTYYQRKRAKELLNNCIIDDKKYMDLLDETGNLMAQNSTLNSLSYSLTSKVEPPQQGQKKESEAVIAKILSSYPWSVMRHNLSKCLLHSFPKSVRKVLWNAAFKDENNKALLDAFMEKKNSTSDTSMLPKAYYQIIDAVVKKKVEEHPIIKEYNEGKLLNDVLKVTVEFVLYRMKAPDVNDLSMVADLVNVDPNEQLTEELKTKVVIKIIERYSSYIVDIFDLFASLYGWEDVTTKYDHLTPVQFYTEKICSLIIYQFVSTFQIDPFEDPELYYKMTIVPQSIVRSFAHATEKKDMTILSHLNSLSNGIEDFLKPVTRLCISYCDHSVTCFLIEQLLFSNFNNVVFGVFMASIALALRQHVLKCETSVSLHTLCKANSSVLLADALVDIMENNFRKYLHDALGVDIYPKEFVEITGLSQEKTTLLFTQDTSSLAPPDKLSSLKAALQQELDQRDEKEMLFVWNDIYEKIEKETTIDIPFKDVNYRLTLPSKRSNIWKETSFYDLSETIMQFSSNKLLCIELAKKNILEEFKQVVSQHVKETGIFKPSDFSSDIDNGSVIEVEYSFMGHTFKTKFLEEQLRTSDYEAILETLKNRLKLLDSFAYGSDVQETAMKFAKHFEQEERSKLENYQKEKEQRLLKITQELENESMIYFSKVLKLSMKGVQLFFKGTEQEIQKVEKLCQEEKEERAIRKEALGRSISTYEYNRLPKKYKQKYDKAIEKKKAANSQKAKKYVGIWQNTTKNK